jgi:hypothetical protein
LARSAFESAGYPEAAAYARALEIACGAADEAEAAALATLVCTAHRPDVAVTVLGVLAFSGRLRGDWRTALEKQISALPDRDPEWRSGALSVNEARKAVESSSRSDASPSK